MKQIPKKNVKTTPQARNISLRLRGNILAELDALSQKHGMSRSSLIQLAIARLLKSGIQP